MTKRLVMFAIAIMITLLGLLVVWQFHIVVVYVLFSLTLAATLRPLVQRLVRRRFLAAWRLDPYCTWWSWAIWLLLFLTGKSAVNEINSWPILFGQDKWVLPPWLEGSSFQLTLFAQLPTPGKLFEALTGNQGSSSCQPARPYTGNFRHHKWLHHHCVLEPILDPQSNSFRTALALVATFRTAQTSAQHLAYHRT